MTDNVTISRELAEKMSAAWRRLDRHQYAYFFADELDAALSPARSEEEKG
jgi:hypothetical protein